MPSGELERLFAATQTPSSPLRATPTNLVQVTATGSCWVFVSDTDDHQFQVLIIGEKKRATAHRVAARLTLTDTVVWWSRPMIWLKKKTKQNKQKENENQSVIQITVRHVQWTHSNWGFRRRLDLSLSSADSFLLELLVWKYKAGLKLFSDSVFDKYTAGTMIMHIFRAYLFFRY